MSLFTLYFETRSNNICWIYADLIITVSFNSETVLMNGVILSNIRHHSSKRQTHDGHNNVTLQIIPHYV